MSLSKLTANLAILLDSTVDNVDSYLNGTTAGDAVDSVVEGGAAEKAGIVPGDVIIAVEDEDISTSEELVEVVSTYKAGEKITITVMTRDKNGYVEKKIDVTLTVMDNES